MSEITADLVKQLRDKTGISIMQCRKALEETLGDLDKAVLLLQERSKDIALKRGDRTLGSGAISSYIHSNGGIGAMVELLCETDFVSNNEEFKALARDIAMHITATNPKFLKLEDITEAARASALESIKAEGGGEDSLDSYLKERVLLEQSFIKDAEVTIQDLIERAIQKFGEHMELSRFTRYSVSQ